MSIVEGRADSEGRATYRRIVGPRGRWLCAASDEHIEDGTVVSVAVEKLGRAACSLAIPFPPLRIGNRRTADFVFVT